RLLRHERPLPGLRDGVGVLGRVRRHGRSARLDARLFPPQALALSTRSTYGAPRPARYARSMPKPLWAPWRLEYVEQVDERPGCIFCDPEPELVLFRGEHAFLLLNRFPYSAGHLMAAPLRHAGDFGGLSDEEALEIHPLPAPAGDAPFAPDPPHRRQPPRQPRPPPPLG